MCKDKTRKQLETECNNLRIPLENELSKEYVEDEDLGELRAFVKSLDHLPDDTEVCFIYESDYTNYRGIVVKWSVAKTDEELEEAIQKEKNNIEECEKIKKDLRRKKYLELKEEFEPTNK
jgi:hypothetical protein